MRKIAIAYTACSIIMFLGLAAISIRDEEKLTVGDIVNGIALSVIWPITLLFVISDVYSGLFRITVWERSKPNKYKAEE